MRRPNILPTRRKPNILGNAIPPGPVAEFDEINTDKQSADGIRNRKKFVTTTPGPRVLCIKCRTPKGESRIPKIIHSPRKTAAKKQGQQTKNETSDAFHLVESIQISHAR